MNLSKQFWVEEAERLVSIFLMSFLGALLASNNSDKINLSTLEQAAFAGLIAVLEVVRSLVASFVPDTTTPASVVKDSDAAKRRAPAVKAVPPAVK